MFSGVSSVWIASLLVQWAYGELSAFVRSSVTCSRMFDLFLELLRQHTKIEGNIVFIGE